MITTPKVHRPHGEPGPLEVTETEQPLVDIRDMLVVHTALLREFRLAPDAVRRAATDDHRAVRRVAIHIGFLCDLLHHHHEGEDELLWPPMLQRCSAEVRELIACGEKQHEMLDAALISVREQLAEWHQHPNGDTADALTDALRRLHAELEHHLDFEEQMLLPHAAALMTEQEWHAIGDAAVLAIAKPQLPLVFGMFAYEGDPSVLAGMLAQAPALPRLLMPRIAPRVYARRAAQLYGTTRP